MQDILKHSIRKELLKQLAAPLVQLERGEHGALGLTALLIAMEVNKLAPELALEMDALVQILRRKLAILNPALKKCAPTLQSLPMTVLSEVGRCQTVPEIGVSHQETCAKPTTHYRTIVPTITLTIVLADMMSSSMNVIQLQKLLSVPLQRGEHGALGLTALLIAMEANKLEPELALEMVAVVQIRKREFATLKLAPKKYVPTLQLLQTTVLIEVGLVRYQTAPEIGVVSHQETCAKPTTPYQTTAPTITLTTALVDMMSFSMNVIQPQKVLLSPLQFGDRGALGPSALLIVEEVNKFEPELALVMVAMVPTRKRKTAMMNLASKSVRSLSWIRMSVLTASKM